MFVHISDVEPSIWGMFGVYAKARDFPNVTETLKEIRKAGLPEDIYQKYLKEAEELGLLDNGFSAEEILQPLKPGFDRYGWGP